MALYQYCLRYSNNRQSLFSAAVVAAACFYHHHHHLSVVYSALYSSRQSIFINPLMSSTGEQGRAVCVIDHICIFSIYAKFCIDLKLNLILKMHNFNIFICGKLRVWIVISDERGKSQRKQKVTRSLSPSMSAHLPLHDNKWANIPVMKINPKHKQSEVDCVRTMYVLCLVGWLVHPTRPIPSSRRTTNTPKKWGRVSGGLARSHFHPAHQFRITHSVVHLCTVQSVPT